MMLLSEVNSDIISVVFEKHFRSEEYLNMVEADAYFNGQNTLIKNKRKMIELSRTYTSPTTQETYDELYLTDDYSKANNKIKHNYLYELIMQCTNYAVGKPLKVDYKKLFNKLGIEDANEDYKEQVEEILYKDNNFLAFIQENVVNVQLYGVSYFRLVYLEGTVKFVVLNPKEIVMFKDDYGTPELCFRFYSKSEYDSKSKSFIDVSYCEVFDNISKLLWKKDIKSNKWIIQGSPEYLYRNNIMHGDVITDITHISTTVFPIIEWSFDSKNTSILSLIKDFVDIIDNDLSELVNNVDDIQDVVWILNNYQGQNLGEFLNDLRKNKAIKVGAGGDVKTHTVDIPTEARKLIYELCERNIYRFGFGVNFLDRTNLGNVTGVGLKWSYAPLEQKANSIEANGQEALDKMFNIIFTLMDIPYDSNDLEFIFNRTMIINEVEKTSMTMSASSIISTETSLDNLPMVIDTEEELVRLREENEYDPIESETEMELDEETREDDEESDNDTQ